MPRGPRAPSRAPAEQPRQVPSTRGYAQPHPTGLRRSGLPIVEAPNATGLCAESVAAVLARPQSVSRTWTLGPPTMSHALVLMEGGISGNLAGVGLVL
ncbi:unnamed protein product [Clonostachys rosea]|uniref:Uncharacterized protein n=1 Tax=Bionectria ochroleuca TaxID=29856 RepID=A0ABY6UQ11_BIOOC|nr:unnamed protein product [Clonostachys rosea]